MKRILFFFACLLFLAPAADACVGKTLTIGVLNTRDSQLLAEMVSSLINERTGTTITVKLYDSEQDLEHAMQAKQVDISIENTTSAVRNLNKPVPGDANKAYELVKSVYEKEKGLVWLKPFGFLRVNGETSPSYTAAVLRIEVINNFPALPRVIGKLANVLNDESHDRLVKSVESGEQPRKAARDFLKAKKLI